MVILILEYVTLTVCVLCHGVTVTRVTRPKKPEEAIGYKFRHQDHCHITLDCSIDIIGWY